MSRYQRTMQAALQDVADGQIEFDEAVKWEVKISGLPTFYADGKSKGEVKQALRKMLKRPDDILSITRTTPAELKKIRRGQITGTEPGEDEEDVKEELLLEIEDNRIIKVKNKELSNDDIVNMIQFGHPFAVVDEEIPPELPGPEVPRYKNVPNSVVDKADKKANKAKARAEKDILIPTQTKEAADTWHPDPEKDKQSTSYKHHVKTLERPKVPIKVPKKDPVFKRTGKVSKVGGKWTVEKEELSHIWLEASDWARRMGKTVASRELAKQEAERERRALQRAVAKSPKQQALARAQEKDKKDQNKNPVGPSYKAGPAWPKSTDEGIVSGAGKVAGAAVGGALALGVSPALGALTGAGIIKKTSDIQQKLDKKKAERKAEQERKLAAVKAEREKKDPRLSKEEVDEVAPPGWGHTKAEKEKTKPDKPKSKIGGSAHEFQKDLDSGKFKGLPGDKTYKDKKASMFKLMWSMKDKGDKPHYKPGVKDKLKSQYKKEDVDEAKVKHPDAGVPLSVRRARKKKSAAQMKIDMQHADQLSKIGKGRRKEQELGNVGVRPTSKWYHPEENLLDATKRYLEEKADWNTAFKSAAKSRPPMKYKDAVSFIDTAELNSTEKRSALKAAKKWLR